MIKRVLYIGYYYSQLDWELFNKFMNYVTKSSGKSKLIIWLDIIRSSFTYNISFLEYFQFGFIEATSEKRKLWAGTGFMYEYQLKMNPQRDREKLEDKVTFLDNYKQFVIHKHFSLNQLEEKPQRLVKMLSNSSKLVLKSRNGKCGNGIEIIKSAGFSPEQVLGKMRESGNDLLEEFVVQHEEINRLSSSGLNTLRVITQVNSMNQVDFLGARLRITVNSGIDNLAAGNLAAFVDMNTGKITRNAVYSDITKASVGFHPITKQEFIGFKIPYWEETIKMVEAAALLYPENRSIGWDVAITNKGPELIEGNHDWCKLLWQLPVGEGLKSDLFEYCN